MKFLQNLLFSGLYSKFDLLAICKLELGNPTNINTKKLSNYLVILDKIDNIFISIKLFLYKFILFACVLYTTLYYYTVKILRSRDQERFLEENNDRIKIMLM